MTMEKGTRLSRIVRRIWDEYRTLWFHPPAVPHRIDECIQRAETYVRQMERNRMHFPDLPRFLQKLSPHLLFRITSFCEPLELKQWRIIARVNRNLRDSCSRAIRELQWNTSNQVQWEKLGRELGSTSTIVSHCRIKQMFMASLCKKIRSQVFRKHYNFRRRKRTRDAFYYYRTSEIVAFLRKEFKGKEDEILSWRASRKPVRLLLLPPR